MSLSGISSPSFFTLICILSVVNKVLQLVLVTSDSWCGHWVHRFLLKIFSELEGFPKTALANSFLFENTAIHNKALNLSSLFSAITYRVLVTLQCVDASHKYILLINSKVVLQSLL